MKARLDFLARGVLTLAVMTLGAVVMLVGALATAFQAPRFYRETIGAAVGRLVLRVWSIEYDVHGAPAPAGEQTVYVSNHTSAIDLFVLIALGLPNTRFFLSCFLRQVLPLGLMGYLIGIFWTVPQDYPERRRQIFQRACRILQRTRESVYLSLEGQRITTGELGHFNKGSFHLATALGAPIVPMYLFVPRGAAPDKRMRARPGTVHVYFAAPVDTGTWRVDDVAQHRDRIKDFYVSWHRELRAAA